MSAFGGKADIIQGKADIQKCPLMTQSGHDPPGYSNCGECNNLDKFPAAPIAANAVTGNWVRPDWE